MAVLSFMENEIKMLKGKIWMATPNLKLNAQLRGETFL